jgi:selenoprotein W-related protein
MKNVSIIYCKPCGYERQAREAAAALRRELGLSATLVPGKAGIFEVRLGDVVVTKRVKGQFPGSADIVEAVSTAKKPRATR